MCFFKRRLRLRTDCKYRLQIDLYIFTPTLLSRLLSAKIEEKVSTVRRHAEILEMRGVIQRKLSEFRQSQRFLMPGLGPVLDELQNEGATEGSLELLLPSELSVEDRATWCHPDIPTLEFRFRVAQADDSLAGLRRLLRLYQALREQNHKQISNVTKAVTRTQGMFNNFRTRIRRCSKRYSHARSAMLALDPDQRLSPEWMQRFQELNKSDIRGPGRELDDKSEGQFTPSWIWLVPLSSLPSPPATTLSSDPIAAATPANKPAPANDELTNSMRAHWAKCQARAERYEEEVTLTTEEMGRVLLYFEWQRSRWLSLQSEREWSDSPPPADVQHGLRAYAHRQANVYDTLIHSFADRWKKTLLSHGLRPTWLSRYSASPTSLQQHQDHSQPGIDPKSAHVACDPPSPSLPTYEDTDSPLVNDVEAGNGNDGNDHDHDHNYEDNDNDDNGGEYVVDDAELFDVEDEFADEFAD